MAKPVFRQLRSQATSIGLVVALPKCAIYSEDDTAVAQCKGVLFHSDGVVVAGLLVASPALVLAHVQKTCQCVDDVVTLLSPACARCPSQDACHIMCCFLAHCLAFLQPLAPSDGGWCEQREVGRPSHIRGLGLRRGRDE